MSHEFSFDRCPESSRLFVVLLRARNQSPREMYGMPMNIRRCCDLHTSNSVVVPRGSDTSHPLTLRRRCLALLNWILPGTILALIPKCPICLAAYLALWTGIGLTLPTATFLRWSLMLVCICSLLFLVVRRARRWLHTSGESSKWFPSRFADDPF